MEAKGTAHEMESTLRYSEALIDEAPHYSPFRPSKVGPFRILAAEITDQDIRIVTEGGTLRYPPELTAWASLPASP